MISRFKRLYIKLLALTSVLMMVVSGCNNVTNSTSEISFFEKEVADSYNVDVSDEPEETDKEQKWSDYVSEELYEELHKDKIKYTVHIDYTSYETDLDFYLPVDINTYVDCETMTYDMYQVLEDYGWQKGEDYYFYIVDDLMIKMIFEISEKNQIELVEYDFVYKDNPEKNYYTYINGFPTDNMELHINFLQGCDCDYLIEGSDDLFVTYDESIVFTYIISWVSVRPYTNPLVFVPHFASYSGDFGKHDRYYIYFG